MMILKTWASLTKKSSLTLSAAFVKCSNIKDRPLEPTYAVLCSVYVSSGFKERSTRRVIEEIWNQRRLELIDELFAHHLNNHGLVVMNGAEVIQRIFSL